MTYRRYAIERVAASLVILFIAVSLAFLLFHVIGMSGVIGPSSSPDEIARYHSYQRQGFGGYLWQFVGHGSLGHAVFDARDLTNETFEQLRAHGT